MMDKVADKLAPALACLLLAACGGGSNGNDGTNSLVTISEEPPGANCPYGGMRIDAGPDTNGNTQLDTEEITQTGYACAVASTAGWKVPTLIENLNAGHALAPQIAFDGNGNAIAVWRQHDGTRYNIMANRYVPGSGWGSAGLIETDDAGSAYDPQVAMDAAGHAIAVWRQHDGTRYNILANRYVPGSGWGSAELIETEDNDSAFEPQVAMNASGNAIAVWRQNDGGNRNIMSNRYLPGFGWGSAKTIQSGNGARPQIAMDGSGNAMAVWQHYDGARYNIRASRYTSGSDWSNDVLIENDNAGNASYPHIALDANGNAIAVWQQSDGQRESIFANRFTPANGWGEAVLLETDDTDDAMNPRIAMDANGSAMAVWQQSDGKRSNIMAGRYVPGNGWSKAELIETDNAGNASKPQVALDSQGNAMAVWLQSDGLQLAIRANRFVPGAGWGHAAPVDTNNALDSDDPQIAFDGSGNAMAVWSQFDGTRSNIHANRWTLE